MSNPYDAPNTPITHNAAALGNVDVTEAYRTALSAIGRNALPWAGALLASVLAISISLLLCILPAFVVIPLMSWGLARFYLDALGHGASQAFVAALAEVRPLTVELRVLGTYPADPASLPAPPP